jgi:transcriptional regulator with XRE-family HTH domain
MGNERSTAANRHIGTRIRERRIMLGLNQRQLGDLIGVTYQQVNKYEHGVNALSAGRLYEVAHELSAPLEYFFEDLEHDEKQPLPRQRMLLDVMRNFGAIQSEKQLEAINDFVRVLAGRRNEGVASEPSGTPRRTRASRSRSPRSRPDAHLRRARP